MDGTNLRVACYGKLPISKEFLRWRCHEGIGLRLHDWMERCFEEAGPRPVLGSGSWMTLRAKGEGGVALALVRDSTDAGGLREFPFALFVEIDGRMLRRRPGLLARVAGRTEPLRRITDLAPTWRSLEARMGEAIAQSGRSELLDWVARASVEGPADGAVRGEATPVGADIPVGEWTGGAWGAPAGPDAWAQALFRLEEGLRGSRGGGADPLRVLVPIAPKFDPGTQLEAWLLMIEALYRPAADIPGIFVGGPGPDGTRAAVLDFDPSVQAGVTIPTAEGLLDLVRSGSDPAPEGFEEWKATVTSDLRSEGATLHDAVVFSRGRGNRPERSSGAA